MVSIADILTDVIEVDYCTLRTRSLCMNNTMRGSGFARLDEVVKIFTVFIPLRIVVLRSKCGWRGHTSTEAGASLLALTHRPLCNTFLYTMIPL
jgi:hypothetical protein